MRDNWINAEKMPLYLDTLRRLFQYFFVTYVDQEKGDLMIRDAERNTVENHTTRMANFDAARYLCQWSRLARVIGGSLAVPLQTEPRPPDGSSSLTNPIKRNMDFFSSGMRISAFSTSCLSLVRERNLARTTLLFPTARAFSIGQLTSTFRSCFPNLLSATK